MGKTKLMKNIDEDETNFRLVWTCFVPISSVLDPFPLPGFSSLAIICLHLEGWKRKWLVWSGGLSVS